MRRHKQVACIRMNLQGDCVVDWRYAAQPGETDSELTIWAEVWHRRDPGLALFVEEHCVEPGGFASREAAFTKLKTMLNGHTPRQTT